MIRIGNSVDEIGEYLHIIEQYLSNTKKYIKYNNRFVTSDIFWIDIENFGKWDDELLWNFKEWRNYLAHHLGTNYEKFYDDKSRPKLVSLKKVIDNIQSILKKFETYSPHLDPSKLFIDHFPEIDLL